ncbi:hypothetical protein E2C01_045665 [Portunus trituberculatus]|uniref:Uncharacterized protein n=1 Tax=Portunus trituberculatus TaxID=210409 RepID=A0A5B7FWE1_PORTR|nr:hypothetical protein [Portunus trituberculatus]
MEHFQLQCHAYTPTTPQYAHGFPPWPSQYSTCPPSWRPQVSTPPGNLLSFALLVPSLGSPASYCAFDTHI